MDSSSLPSNLTNLPVAPDTTNCTGMSTSAQFERVFKTLLLVLIALANVLGNSCVCFVVLKDRQLRTTVRNYAVASLAVSDLLVIQVITFHALAYYNIGKQCDLCQVMGKIFGSLLYVSILHLCALSLDRYVAIFYPLHYRFMVTPKRAIIILATIWFLPVFSIAILPAIVVSLRGFASFYVCAEVGFIGIRDMSNRVHMYVNVTFLFLLPLVVMMAAYYRICKIAWYQSNRVGIAVVSVVRLPQFPSLPRARERKWAKTLAIVIGTFLFCYLPVVVASMMHVRADPTRGPSIRKALELLLFPTYLNTVLNPLIYSHRSKDYRRAFRKVFFSRRCRESSSTRNSRLNYARRESQTVSSHVTSST